MTPGTNSPSVTPADTDPTGIDPAAQRYLRLAQRFRADAPKHAMFRSVRGRKDYIRSEAVLEIEDVQVLAGEWIVIAGDRILCDFLVQTPSPPLSAYLTRFGFEDDIIELIHEPPRKLAVSRAFLLGGCANYSHWLLDYLPRLRLCRDSSLPLLVNAPPTPFQLDSLRCLGIDDARLLALEYPAAVSVRHLLYPSICSSSFTPPHSLRPEVPAWLREVFAPSGASGRRDRKLFISRAEEVHSHRRRLLNHEEIAGIAQRHGFEIVTPEKLRFAEQVRLFSRAAVIAGAHGAGFANMVFAPKEARLIELIGPRFGRSAWSMGYARLAVLSGQSVTRIVGRADAADAPESDHLPNETYFIDPAEFASVARD